MREDILRTKKEKLRNLRAMGIDPYPEKTRRNCVNQKALEDFDLIKEEIILAGRIKSLRPMGNATFAHIEDGTAKIQIFFSKSKMSPEKYKLFCDNAEIGDIVEVSGKLFRTKTGEKSLAAKNWKILAKSVRPVPVEYFGLKDKETLLRKRYLDLMMNAETRDLFRKKAIFWSSVRRFLEREGFLEVDTPALEAVPGGADARPFITHHNALNRDFYLRISLELPLKRLLVGGFEKVFEIGKVFRNEGIDSEHLQDYQHMEFYWAYADMEKGMDLAERMFKEVIYQTAAGEALTSFQGTEADFITIHDQDQKINWSDQWPVLDYYDEFEKKTGINLSEQPEVTELKKAADSMGVVYDENWGKGRMIDAIFKKKVRPTMIQPCFLTGHPIEISPLAKRDPQKPGKVLRFQIIAGGSELGNGFSELNDPLEQWERFNEQMKLRQRGDVEAHMIDEDFVEALEYGMPPAVGFGMSERLFAFIMNRPIRETVIFPPMKEKKV